MSELNSFSAIVLIYLTIVKNGVAIADGLHNAPTELLSCQGAPSTFALDEILCEGPGGSTLDNRDVCFIAWAEESAVFD